MPRAVRTPDGQALAVEDPGDPAGRVVLVHGWTPNSRHLYGPNMADKPPSGACGSSAMTGPGIGGCPHDRNPDTDQPVAT